MRKEKEDSAMTLIAVQGTTFMSSQEWGYSGTLHTIYFGPMPITSLTFYLLKVISKVRAMLLKFTPVRSSLINAASKIIQTLTLYKISKNVSQKQFHHSKVSERSSLVTFLEG